MQKKCAAPSKMSSIMVFYYSTKCSVQETVYRKWICTQKLDHDGKINKQMPFPSDGKIEEQYKNCNSVGKINKIYFHSNLLGQRR